MPDIPYWIREAVYRRDDMHCRYCDAVCILSADCGPNHPRKATLDHIIHECDDGPDTFDNLVLACQSCNTARGNAPVMPMRMRGVVSGEMVRELARRIVREE